MAAAALLVHCRRAARPPYLHTIGPERASLSALSLPDPHPALARAGVILAAAASRRPPARHCPQPGAESPWASPPPPPPPSLLTLPPPLLLPLLPPSSATAVATATFANTAAEAARCAAPRSCPTWPPRPHARCCGGLAPGMARVAAAPGFGGGANRAERWFGASQVAAAFL